MSLLRAACSGRWRLTVALLATLGISARETDNWPSFRGPAALAVADDDPRLPIDLEHHRERGLEDAHRGARLVLAGGLGEPRLPDHRHQRRSGRGAAHGALLPVWLSRLRRHADQGGRPQEAREGRPPLAGLRRRLRQRRGGLEDRGERRAARASIAISRTPTLPKRRSPTARTSTPTSATSACGASTWTATRSGRLRTAD